jgi:hypothetical protein
MKAISLLREEMMIIFYGTEERLKEISLLDPTLAGAVMVNDLKTLLEMSNDEFSYILLDYNIFIKPQTSGLKKIIFELGGFRCFAAQIMQTGELFYLRLNPLERFTLEQFKEKKPWIMTKETKGRDHIRFNIQVPVEIQTDQLLCLKLYSYNVSFGGLLLPLDLEVGLKLQIHLAKMLHPMDAVVLWKMPWGEVGRPSCSGVQFVHTVESKAALKQFMKMHVIPKAIQIQFQND